MGTVSYLLRTHTYQDWGGVDAVKRCSSIRKRTKMISWEKLRFVYFVTRFELPAPEPSVITRVHPISPPVSAFAFCRSWVSELPRFTNVSLDFANSSSCAFRRNKTPYKATGGNRTHARGGLVLECSTRYD